MVYFEARYQITSTKPTAFSLLKRRSSITMCSITFNVYRCGHKGETVHIACPEKKSQGPHASCRRDDLVVWDLPKDYLCNYCSRFVGARQPAKILRPSIRVSSLKYSIDAAKTRDFQVRTGKQKPFSRTKKARVRILG
jgi:hypothetical protein